MEERFTISIECDLMVKKMLGQYVSQLKLSEQRLTEIANEELAKISPNLEDIFRKEFHSQLIQKVREIASEKARVEANKRYDAVNRLIKREQNP